MRTSARTGPAYRRRRLAAASSLLALLLLAVPAWAGTAGTAGPAGQVPSPVPATGLPYVEDGAVQAFAQVGSLMVVGGSFTSVRPAGGTNSLPRRAVLAFDPTTGSLQSFSPMLDGTVQALLAGPTPGTVFVAGTFKNVNGVPSRGLALLDLATGRQVPSFAVPRLNGAVTTLRNAAGRLLVGGTFTTAAGLARAGLLSASPTTGAVDGFLALPLTGHHNCGRVTGAVCAATGAARVAVSPDGTRLVVIGNFTSVGGVARDQVAVLSLQGATAAVDPGWSTDAYTATCAANQNDSYVRDVDYAPAGGWFVVVTTGASDPLTTTCDAAARFEDTAPAGAPVRPTWTDSTGRDTLGSVQVTAAAVFVGGHQRWLNNANGLDSAGPGAVPRPGIAALDPVNGLPLAWNPGRNPRGVGAFALLATDRGLWVGSDTTLIGNYKYKRGKFAFFPFDGGPAVAPATRFSLPATVYLAGPAADRLQARTFDGSTSPGPAVSVPAPTVDWSTVRGGFSTAGRLFFATGAGELRSVPYDGTDLGAATPVDPYDDPVWSNVKTGSAGAGQTYRGVPPTFYGATAAALTGLAYLPDLGRVYYTRSGRSGLYSRAFSADAGVVGDTESLVPTSVPFSSTTGLFAVGSTLYSADAAGRLSGIPLDPRGVPTGTVTVLSGPGLDGVDWRAGALFAGPPPSTPAARPSYVAGASVNGLAPRQRVVVPASVAPGNVLLLFVAANSPSVPVAPAGWRLLDSRTTAFTSAVYVRVADASDAGAQVDVEVGGTVRATVDLLAYSGVDPTDPVAQSVITSDVAKTDHATPALGPVPAGATVVSAWADKSSSTAPWAGLPGGLTVRSSNVPASGTGLVSAMIGDRSGAAAAAGVVASRTDSAAIMRSVALRPAG